MNTSIGTAVVAGCCGNDDLVAECVPAALRTSGKNH